MLRVDIVVTCDRCQGVIVERTLPPQPSRPYYVAQEVVRDALLDIMTGRTWRQVGVEGPRRVEDVCPACWGSEHPPIVDGRNKREWL